MLDWNDLQHLYALAKYSTLPEAAEALGINRTTVARRINHLEEKLGAKLVERMGRDLVLTDAGREAASSAEIIDGEFQNLHRRVFGRDQQLAGVIRLTLTPAIGNLLAPQLAAFSAKHPELLLEISSTNASEDLEVMESDVALRLTSKPPENLVGRRLVTPMLGVYGNKVLYQSTRNLDIPMDVVSLYGVNRNTLFAREDLQAWIEDILGSKTRPMMQSNSTDLIREYVANSNAVAILPCYVAEADERLIRIGEPRKDGFAELWLLYHPRLRRLQRFRAFTEYLVAQFDLLRPTFEGEPCADSDVEQTRPSPNSSEDEPAS